MIRFDQTKKRAVISCEGDVAVLHFSAPENDNGGLCGTEWVLLQQWEKGEIGRSALGRGPVDLSKCEGILIGCTDPRSCDVVVAAFQAAAESLRARMKERA